VVLDDDLPLVFGDPEVVEPERRVEHPRKQAERHVLPEQPPQPRLGILDRLCFSSVGLGDLEIASELQCPLLASPESGYYPPTTAFRSIPD
jgi:hypothetical protein